MQVQTEVFITLKNQYEIAQIDEVNDPKIIEVLNYPEKPMKRISPGSPAFSLLRPGFWYNIRNRFRYC